MRMMYSPGSQRTKVYEQNAACSKAQPSAAISLSQSSSFLKSHARQVYVPGFGYVDYEGDNVGIKDDSMYENGNKIGIMGG